MFDYKWSIFVYVYVFQVLIKNYLNIQILFLVYTIIYSVVHI